MEEILIKHEENPCYTCEEDGKKRFFSRSCAVVGFVVTKNPSNEIPYFLVSQRGPGCPDWKGCYAASCGYLDWGENLEQAVDRELWEELGLDTSEYSKYLWKVISDPTKDARQNVVFRYIIYIPWDKLKDELENNLSCDTVSRGGQAGEVTDIRLISLSDIDNYKWAFNHREVIKEMVKEYMI